MDYSFKMSRCLYFLDSSLKNYEIFLRFQFKFGHALIHWQCNKICPSCPFQEESGMGQILHVEDAPEHVPTIPILNTIAFINFFLFVINNRCM
jgi:hypothetical protein